MVYLAGHETNILQWNKLWGVHLTMIGHVITIAGVVTIVREQTE